MFEIPLSFKVTRRIQIQTWYASTWWNFPEDKRAWVDQWLSAHYLP